jgi:hypothetical protein
MTDVHGDIPPFTPEDIKTIQRSLARTWVDLDNARREVEQGAIHDQLLAEQQRVERIQKALT